MINGKLTVKKNSVLNPTDAKKVDLMNNGILHLFSRINYSIASSSSNIDSAPKVGDPQSNSDP